MFVAREYIKIHLELTQRSGKIVIKKRVTNQSMNCVNSVRSAPLMMFYLNGRVASGGTARIDRSLPNEEDEFGWFVGGVEYDASTAMNESKDYHSSGSSTSMLSCIDSDEADAYTFASDYSKNPEEDETSEKIELSNLTHPKELCIDFIENDARIKKLVCRDSIVLILIVKKITLKPFSFSRRV